MIFQLREACEHPRTSRLASLCSATPSAASHPPALLCSSHPPVACFSSMPRAGGSAASLAAATWTEAALPGAVRAFRSSATQLADVTVSVPSMGESITEGTVAAILKQPGVQSRGVGRPAQQECRAKRLPPLAVLPNKRPGHRPHGCADRPRSCLCCSADLWSLGMFPLQAKWWWRMM